MCGPSYYLDYSTNLTGLIPMSVSHASAVPNFYLYGEPQRNVAQGFVHVESLDDRSRPSEWTIRPHLHHDLNHIILIAEGGGSMLAEGEHVSFDAPCLLLIPSGVVHGFNWTQESRGWVTTIAGSYFHELLSRDAGLRTLFRTPCVVGLKKRESDRIEWHIGQLGRELNWSRPGSRAAVEASLLFLMVSALRSAELEEGRERPFDRTAALVARLRQRIEDRFRLRESVAAHAQALGVSESGLRQACAQVAGMSPAAMLDERCLLEARRLLLYSQLSVAEIAHSLGFDDAAYFSRFFTRHAGKPPSRWRASQRPDGDD